MRESEMDKLGIYSTDRTRDAAEVGEIGIMIWYVLYIIIIKVGPGSYLQDPIRSTKNPTRPTFWNRARSDPMQT